MGLEIRVEHCTNCDATGKVEKCEWNHEGICSECHGTGHCVWVD